MVALGLAASLLSFAPPDPAPMPEWGPSSSVIVSRPAAPLPAPALPPPEPPRAPSMGIGLYVGGAVAFTLGFAGRINQVDGALEHCGDWQQSDFVSMTQCFDYFDPPTLDGNDLFVGFAYGAGMVMTMMGSQLLGRHQAWQTAFADRRARSPVSRWVFGAAFTGLGIAAISTHFALVYTDARNPCHSWECNVERRALWIAASDGGAVLLNTGFGLLTWGSSYSSALERYRMQWSLIPTGTGASASLRF